MQVGFKVGDLVTVKDEIASLGTVRYGHRRPGLKGEILKPYREILPTAPARWIVRPESGYHGVYTEDELRLGHEPEEFREEGWDEFPLGEKTS